MNDLGFVPSYEEPKDTETKENLGFVPIEDTQYSLVDRFMQGLSQESTAGKLGQVVGQRLEDVPDPEGLVESLVTTAGAETGNFPFYLIGGALGASLGSVGGPLGAAAGGMFGTMAFPAFLKEAVNQYHDFQDKGGDLTFGDFMQRADKVAGSTLNEGLFGIILGSVSKSIEVLKKIPAMKKLFDTKYVGKPAEVATKIGGMGTAMTALEAATTGELPGAEDVVRNFITAAGFEAASATPALMTSINDAYIKSKQTPEAFWKSKTGEALKSKIIEEGLPRTSTEQREEALNILKSFEQAEVSPIEQRPTFPTEKETTQGLPLQLKKVEDITAKEPRKPKRAERIKEMTPEERRQFDTVGRLVSNKAFNDDAAAGREIQKSVKEASLSEKKTVNEAYKKAQQVYKNESDIFPDLASYIDERIAQLSVSKSPSPGEAKALNVYKNVKGMLTDLSGKSYIEVPIETLIKTSDSVSQQLSYGTLEPDAKNILRDVPRVLNDAAIKSLESKGVDATPIKEADRKYGDWSSKYINDEISPYLETREVNPEELLRLSMKEKQYRSIDEALPESKEKTSTMKKLAREIIEDRLGEYIRNPEKVGTDKYEREIRNLHAVIGEENVRPVHEELEARKEKIIKEQREEGAKAEREKAAYKELKKKQERIVKPARKAISETKKVPERETRFSKKIKEVAKWANADVDTIKKKMDSISGMRELEADISKKKGGKKAFESLKKAKIRDIFEQGKIHKDSTGKDVANLLNDRKTYELLEEMIGKDELKYIYDAAQELGKEKKFTKANVIKVARALGAPISKAGGWIVLWEILRTLTRGKSSYEE